jgi:hypothetical protein
MILISCALNTTDELNVLCTCGCTCVLCSVVILQIVHMEKVLL